MTFFQKFIYLFFTLNLIFSLVICLDIAGRHEQACTMAGSKFICAGGWTDGNIASTEILSLDFSTSVDTKNPQWNKVCDMSVGYTMGSAVVVQNGSSVFLVGGRLFVPNSGNLSDNIYPVLALDLNSSQVTNLDMSKVSGYSDSFNCRNEMNTVVDNTGKVFSFSGRSYDNETLQFNDMHVFDTAQMSWAIASMQSNPFMFNVDYSATMLSDGRIVYIGGFSPNASDLTAVQVFDTKTSTWNNQQTGGLASRIDIRIGHSAVATPDGKIYVYGGAFLVTLGTRVGPDLVTLDTGKWEWDILSVPYDNAPPPLSYHSAALFNEFMIIAFGRVTNNYKVKELSKNIYIFNTKTNQWVAST